MKDSESLLRWFDSQKRSLPWRESRDPYRVWVSEVMLQQTQVQTVIPYYASFVRKFPTVEKLASATLEDILAAWSGLGYYRRARQMHRAAKVVAESLEGFPSTSRELQKLPGIGPYTAAAVASIAFDEVVPVLDGNVERVMARRLAIGEDPKLSAVRNMLLSAAGDLLDSDQPGESNQALMELGATVCRPKQPACVACPLERGCMARKLDNPEAFPPPRRRRAVERVEMAVGVVRRGSEILLFRRPENSVLMAGLWELPNSTFSKSLKDVERAFRRRYGGCWQLEPTGAVVHHGITYRSLSLHVYLARIEGGDSVAEGPDAAWVSRKERSIFAASSAVDKILEKAGIWV